MSSIRRPTAGRARRASFEHGGFRFTANIGRFQHIGQIGEIFLGGSKAGTHVAAAAQDASIICSIALQNGTPVGVLRHAIARNSHGSAAGPLGKALDLLAKEAAT
jgi:hypothetical protein